MDLRSATMRRLPFVISIAGMVAALLVIVFDLLSSREYELAEGEKRLAHFTQMLAEHSARSFEAVDLMLGEVALDMAQTPNWPLWSEQQGFLYVSHRRTKALPQMRDLAIYDADGNQRFISSYFPTPQVNIADRPYFQKLKDGTDTAHYGPYVGRNSGRYTYALSRRVRRADADFGGVILAAMEPAYFQSFCWANRISDEFDAALTNAEGVVIASCRPTDLSRNSPVVGRQALEVLANGAFRHHVESPGDGGIERASWNGHLLAIAPVENFPEMRIVAVIPNDAFLAQWYRRVTEVTILSLIALTAVMFGMLIIRRQLAELRQMAQELRDSQVQLARRVREATGELARKKEEAERATLARSRFLAAASHDLRQPLHALGLFVTDLKKQVSTPQQRHLVDRINSSVSATSGLLDALLDVSRLDVAGITPIKRQFALQELFDQIEQSFGRSASDKGLRLRCRPTRLHVYSDPTLLERLISNLVDNAIRYTPQGTILVAARHRGDHVRIEVRDSGLGIAPEHQQAIFTEFYQVGNQARESSHGLGLGLSIVSRLARALGTRATLRSAAGKGSLFAIEQPLTGTSQSNNTPLPAPAAIKAILLQRSDNDWSELRQLLQTWNYPMAQVESAAALKTQIEVDRQRYRLLIVADASEEAQRWLDAAAAALRETTILLLSDGEEKPLEIPEARTYTLSPRIRPAKLRALLQQVAQPAPPIRT